MATPTEDDRTNRADVDLLLDLLDLIPVPDLHDQREFWAAVSMARFRDHTHTDYIVGKLAPNIERLDTGEGGAYEAENLASYCLMFFDGDQPDLWPLLDLCVNYASGGAAGRRWATAVSEVAWRIYVPIRAAGQRDDDPTRRRRHTAWKLRNRR